MVSEMRMAFEIRWCSSSPRRHSEYTVAVEMRRRSATSRTVNSTPPKRAPAAPPTASARVSANGRLVDAARCARCGSGESPDAAVSPGCGLGAARCGKGSSPSQAEGRGFESRFPLQDAGIAALSWGAVPAFFLLRRACQQGVSKREASPCGLGAAPCGHGNTPGEQFPRGDEGFGTHVLRLTEPKAWGA